jgi:hypothetical protein
MACDTGVGPDGQSVLQVETRDAVRLPALACAMLLARETHDGLRPPAASPPT